MHRIDKIYEEFDEDHNGILDKSELKKMMQAIEDRAHKGKKSREAFGVVIRIKVTDDDVNYILGDCDLSHDGGIDKGELLPALAKWEMLAEQHLKEQSSCACVVC